MSITGTIDGTERQTLSRCLSTIFANSAGITWQHSAGTEMTPNTERKGTGEMQRLSCSGSEPMPATLSNKPLAQLRLYACYATNKCRNQVQKTNWGLYCRFLTFARSTVSYSQTCSDTKPVAPRLRENRNAPYSSPKIEKKSSGIRHCLA